jgi:hypothetical protein
MTLFNLIYALKICGTNLNDGKEIGINNFIAFTLSVGLFLIGVASTIIMLVKDHSVKNDNTLGKIVTVIKCENITGDNFFSKYSILVLTGNSLPVFNNIVCIIIYLTVLISLGIVYSTQKMYYMNPCFGILKLNIVKATCKIKGKSEKEYYFIYKNGTISEGSKINFLNIPNRIIRLKEIKDDSTNKTTN